MYFTTFDFQQVLQVQKRACLIWVSGGKKKNPIKTVPNRGIRAIFFFGKKRVKPRTVLVETVLSRDPLYLNLFACTF